MKNGLKTRVRKWIIERALKRQGAELLGDFWRLTCDTKLPFFHAETGIKLSLNGFRLDVAGVVSFKKGDEIKA